MPNNEWASLLGLAQRAGKVSSGEDTVLRLIRLKKAKMVLLSADASERTKKTIQNKCGYYHVPLLTVPDREVLGQAIGQPSRVIIAVTDQGFAGRLIEKIGPSSRG
ncbi:YlxQ family RNA-binding protein [Sporolactobacillus sp. CPB3-1]|uniref:YlxQ family RNA-binding protein n=1 Tax=Sporolactobacillus mangiferae TaxID=2940498 RepID=A0ABT0M7K6_9BACL|nr:YlxQ family RNA-binding protein [Sporolactobacillus mangiferae]MCL1630845.1 YlxQ family RNA-binding protein [Sporolactobacillus mangiferae]